MSIRLAALAVASTLALAPVAVQAETVSVDVSGTLSFDGPGSPNNTVIDVNIGAGKKIIGFGWDVTLTAFDPSWISDMTIGIGPATGPSEVFLTPGFASSFPGTESISDVGLLADFNVPDILVPAGIARLEFFENFDDFADVADGEWEGTVRLEVAVIPLPASGVLLLGSLLGAGAIARRRQAARNTV